MTTFMDRWDLRPQERRLVVVFAGVLFVLSISGSSGLASKIGKW